MNCCLHEKIFHGHLLGLLLKPGPEPLTWTQKNLDSEKNGIDIGLTNMSGFRGLCFKKTMGNVIYYLKVRILTNT